MYTVELRFYEELNDFLPKERRRLPFTVGFADPRSVKDLIEAVGVPHTEIDLILVNGESVGFAQPVRDGDRISVYPKFEALDIHAASRLGRPPLRDCRFIADVHLGKLVRRLRLLGFDCTTDRAWDDPELARRSVAEERILLTRDRDLLKRAIVTHGIYLHSDQPDRQLQEVLRRLDLYRVVQPFARCLDCNAQLAAVAKEAVRELIPLWTYQYTDEYFQCTGCRKVYWKGTHWPRLARIIQEQCRPEPADEALAGS